MSNENSTYTESDVSSAIFYDAKNINANDISNMVGKSFQDGVKRLNENIESYNNQPVDLLNVDLPSNKEVREQLEQEAQHNNKINNQIEEDQKKTKSQAPGNLMQAIASKIGGSSNKFKADRFDDLISNGAKPGLISRQDKLNKEAGSLLMKQRFWDNELMKQEATLNHRLKREYKNKTGKNIDIEPLDALNGSNREDSKIIAEILATNEKATEDFAKYMHATNESADSAINMSEYLKEKGGDLGESVAKDIMTQLYGTNGKDGSRSRIEKATEAIESSEHEDLSEKLEEMMKSIKELFQSLVAIFKGRSDVGAKPSTPAP